VKAWVKKRAKQRKDGRLVLVTTVVFDAQVFDDLYGRVAVDGQRSAVISEALRYALGVPGWLEGTLARLGGGEEGEPEQAASVKVPSSKVPSSRGVASAQPAQRSDGFGDVGR